jgi:HlyD family secretion protein
VEFACGQHHARRILRNMSNSNSSKRLLLKAPKWWPILPGIGLALVIGAFVFNNQNPPQNTQATKTKEVKTAPVVSQITSLGRVESSGGSIRLSAPVSFEGTRIAKLLVKEGDKVQTGQLLAVLDSRERLRASLAESDAQVKSAQARLGQVKAGAKRADLEAQRAEIARLEAELQTAQANYQRYQQLFEEGALAVSDFDNRRLAVQTVKQQLNRAQATLLSLAEVRSVDVEVARTEVDRAQAATLRAKANMETSYLRAPQDGQVLAINTKPGEVVSDEKEGIMEIGQTGQMYVVAEIYESDIGKVKPGQRAAITSNALDKPLQGTVERLGLRIGKKDVLDSDPTADVDARIIEVKVRLDPASSRRVERLTNLQVKVAIQP